MNPIVDDNELLDTPEDVAVLYSWANMHGAKYRDFSASRREYRAQLRQKAMEAQREAELRAAREREEAARREEETAQRAVAESAANRAASDEAQRAAERARRSREDAERHAHAASLAEKAALDAEREVEEARRHAAEQAARYAESDSRRRAFAGPQPGELPGQVSDPYHYSGHSSPEYIVGGSGARNAAGRSSAQRPAYRPEVKSDSRQYPSEPFREHARPIQDEIRREDRSGSRPQTNFSQDSLRRDSRSDMRTAERLSDTAQRDRERQYGRDSRETSARSVTSSSYRREGYREEPISRPDWITPRHENVDEAVPRSVYQHLGEMELNALEREDQKLEDRARGIRHVPERKLVVDPERNFREVPVETRTQPRPWFEGKSREDQREQAAQHAQAQQDIHQEMQQERRSVRRTDSSERPHTPPDQGMAQRRAEEIRFRAEDARNHVSQDDERHPGAVRREQEIRREASLREQYGVTESGFHPAAGAARPRTASSRPPAAARPSGQYFSDQITGKPAWLADSQEVSAAPNPPLANSDTLQQSRERVAARWFALKELMGAPSESKPAEEAAKQRDVRVPMVAVVSVAGGVGKTSMVATLGRTLSAMGEKVLLADTATSGMLPYYFGSRDLRPGRVRTFSPPVGSPDAPVYMVNYEADLIAHDQNAQDEIYEDLKQASRGIHRVLLDLNVGSAWLARRVAKSNPVVLVPLAPDMNSMLGIQAVERVLGSMQDADGKPLQPFFVLNQFDASLPLHLDVREAMRQMLGERLLPIVIRRTPAVSEALAEGMTVMDYAPTSQISEDYTQLAHWIRSLTAPATTVFRGMRWSEG